MSLGILKLEPEPDASLACRAAPAVAALVSPAAGGAGLAGLLACSDLPAATALVPPAAGGVGLPLPLDRSDSPVPAAAAAALAPPAVG